MCQRQQQLSLRKETMAETAALEGTRTPSPSSVSASPSVSGFSAHLGALSAPAGRLPSFQEEPYWWESFGPISRFPEKRLMASLDQRPPDPINHRRNIGGIRTSLKSCSTPPGRFNRVLPDSLAAYVAYNAVPPESGSSPCKQVDGGPRGTGPRQRQVLDRQPIGVYYTSSSWDIRLHPQL